MIALTKAQRARLIVAHRIDLAPNVIPVDFAPAEPKPRVWVSVGGGVFVLTVLVGATLALLSLPGAH